jgi:cytochrome c
MGPLRWIKASRPQDSDGEAEGELPMSPGLRMSLAAAVAATFAVPGASLAQKAPSEAQSIAIGRAVVERNCAMCHAVGSVGGSPNPSAPPFRDLSQRLDVDALGEGLAQGILTQHPSMPEFRLTTTEVVGVIRYIRSVQKKQRTDSGSTGHPVG